MSNIREVTELPVFEPATDRFAHLQNDFPSDEGCKP